MGYRRESILCDIKTCVRQPPTQTSSVLVEAEKNRSPEVVKLASTHTQRGEEEKRTKLLTHTYREPILEWYQPKSLARLRPDSRSVARSCVNRGKSNRGDAPSFFLLHTVARDGLMTFHEDAALSVLLRTCSAKVRKGGTQKEQNFEGIILLLFSCEIKCQMGMVQIHLCRGDISAAKRDKSNRKELTKESSTRLASRYAYTGGGDSCFSPSESKSPGYEHAGSIDQERESFFR